MEGRGEGALNKITTETLRSWGWPVRPVRPARSLWHASDIATTAYLLIQPSDLHMGNSCLLYSAMRKR